MKKSLRAVPFSGPNCPQTSALFEGHGLFIRAQIHEESAVLKGHGFIPAQVDEEPAVLKGHGFIPAQVHEQSAALKGHGFIRATNRGTSTRLQPLRDGFSSLSAVSARPF
ncbi:MAG TPA: hypothetical protein VGF82_02695 [Terracidiphilus sp.]